MSGSRKGHIQLNDWNKERWPFSSCQPQDNLVIPPHLLKASDLEWVLKKTFLLLIWIYLIIEILEWCQLLRLNRKIQPRIWWFLCDKINVERKLTFKLPTPYLHSSCHSEILPPTVIFGMFAKKTQLPIFPLPPANSSLNKTLSPTLHKPVWQKISKIEHFQPAFIRRQALCWGLHR